LSSGAPFDVLAVGEALVDLVAPDAEDLEGAERFLRTAGGAPANVAAAVARRLVTPLHRSGGQAQYIEAPIAPVTSDIVAWASDNVASGLTVDDLARHASVSPRTLTRKFRSSTGLASGEWLQRERLRRAQALLETTDLPIEHVARRAGYHAGVSMRSQFRLHLSTSPRAYRKAFRN